MSEEDYPERQFCLKEELNLSSICESGAEFEISNIKNDFGDVEPSQESTDLTFQFTNKLLLNSDESFEDLAKNFHGITEDNLVRKQVLEQGSGPIVSPSSSIVVHYVAYLEFTDEPFDSSRKRKNAFRFDMGHSSVVEGFEVAVATMRRRETSRFLISPQYAFGSFGCPPRIPGNATCLYIIQLIDFQAVEDDAKLYFNLPIGQRNNASLDVMLKAFHSVKDKAKKSFNDAKLKEANSHFSKALNILNGYSIKDEKEENKLKPELIKLYVNLALCNLKLMHSAKAITFSNEALKLDSKNVKALFFRGKALGQLGEFERAIKPLKVAMALKPEDKDIKKEFDKMEKYIKVFLKPFHSDPYVSGSGDSIRDQNCLVRERELIASKLDLLIKDENLLELQFLPDQFSELQTDLLQEMAAEKNLMLRKLKDSSGREIIHLQKIQSNA